MRARKARFYNLRRPRLRQSWNKYNLFNIANFTPKGQRHSGRTFFQQKWYAKSNTRGYHGAHIGEQVWARMFSRRSLSTVDLSPQYLARFDGSEQSAGRGSGLQVRPGQSPVTAASFAHQPRELPQRDARYSSFRVMRYHGGDKGETILNKPLKKMTPHMQMVYAPLERRLETAIFRAMFASSTLQARQFCIHGAVTVNGQKMRYPAYQLQPGDIFQVDPERVLFATGMPKNPLQTALINKRLEEQEQRAAAREAREQAVRDAKLNQLDAKLQSAQERGGGEGVQAEASEQAAADTAVEAETAAAVEEAAAATSHLGEDGEPATEEERQASHKSELKRVAMRARSILKDKSQMSAPLKQRVRLFLAEAKRAIATASKTSGDPVDADAAELSREAVMIHLASILKNTSLDDGTTTTDGGEDASSKPAANTKAALEAERADLSPKELEQLEELLRQDAENPVDESKPYLTPWQPRKYLAPFAFIPRYLEVNQNICAAIYLRHPVARRGSAEVPTPFSNEMNQLTFNWYLRRR